MVRRLIFLVTLFWIVPQIEAQIVTTIAGNGSVGATGDNGPATSATFSVFSVVAVDKENNLYIADVGNHKIRKVDLLTNFVTTYAGTGSAGFSGDGGPALMAQFNSPTYIAINSMGDLYVTDGNNHRIRKIEKSSGIITTVAGNGSVTYTNDGIPAITASMGPIGICIDKNDELIINDNSNHRIRKVNQNGTINTICGIGVDGYSGDGGLATQAEIGGVSGICVDDSDNIYIACINQARVRKIDAMTGVITTFAGNGNVGFSGDGAQANFAELNWPFNVSSDKNGDIYIADQVNNRIRKVNSLGIISTIAGDGITGFDGDGGPADTATFNRPGGVAFDTCGNMYIADKMNKRVRKVIFNDTCGLLSTKALQALSKNIDIYPNPAQTKLSISASVEVAEVLVANTVGQVVCRKEGKGNGKMELDISDLQPGIYFVTVKDKQGVKVTKKVVKE